MIIFALFLLIKVIFGNTNLTDKHDLLNQASFILDDKDKNLPRAEIERAIALLHDASREKIQKADVKLAIFYLFGKSPFFPPNYHLCSKVVDECKEAECIFIKGLLIEHSLYSNDSSPYNDENCQNNQFEKIDSEKSSDKLLQSSLNHEEVVNKEKEANALYYMAALAGSRSALLTLGNMYAKGNGLPKDCLKARDLLFPVASALAERMAKERIRTFPRQYSLKEDPIRAMETLSIPTDSPGDQRAKDTLEFYIHNSDEEDPESLFFLGQVYYTGIGGTNRNFDLARNYFERAAKAGSASAEAYLGQMDFYGEGCENGTPNLRRAYHSLRRAARKNSATGLNGMGLFYWHGMGEVVPDLHEALKYFRLAASMDSPEASYNLGKVLSLIDPIANENAIFETFLEGLRRGFVICGYELAKLYISRPEGCGMCVSLLQNFLSKHNIVSILEEANSFYNEGLVEYAFPRYLYLAQQGFTVAQYNLAFMLNRIASKKNFNRLSQIEVVSLYRRAFHWWSRLSVTTSEAKRKMGDYFFYGLGIPKSPKTAAALYYAAGVTHSQIENGIEFKQNVQALFNLGLMYQFGMGLDRDLYMARKYYQMATMISHSALKKQPNPIDSDGLYVPDDRWATFPLSVMIFLLDVEEILLGKTSFLNSLGVFMILFGFLVIVVVILCQFSSCLQIIRGPQNRPPSDTTQTNGETQPLLRVDNDSASASPAHTQTEGILADPKLSSNPSGKIMKLESNIVSSSEYPRSDISKSMNSFSNVSTSQLLKSKEQEIILSKYVDSCDVDNQNLIDSNPMLIGDDSFRSISSLCERGDQRKGIQSSKEGAQGDRSDNGFDLLGSPHLKPHCESSSAKNSKFQNLNYLGGESESNTVNTQSKNNNSDKVSTDVEPLTESLRDKKVGSVSETRDLLSDDASLDYFDGKMSSIISLAQTEQHDDLVPVSTCTTDSVEVGVSSRTELKSTDVGSLDKCVVCNSKILLNDTVENNMIEAEDIGSVQLDESKSACVTDPFDCGDQECPRSKFH